MRGEGHKIGPFDKRIAAVQIGSDNFIDAARTGR